MHCYLFLSHSAYKHERAYRRLSAVSSWVCSGLLSLTPAPGAFCAANENLASDQASDKAPSYHMASLKNAQRQLMTSARHPWKECIFELEHRARLRLLTKLHAHAGNVTASATRKMPHVMRILESVMLSIGICKTHFAMVKRVEAAVLSQMLPDMKSPQKLGCPSTFMQRL